MNLPTFIALIVVSVVVAAIVVRQVKKMKSGGCSCDCATCGCCKSSGSCGSHK